MRIVAPTIVITTGIVGLIAKRSVEENLEGNDALWPAFMSKPDDKP